MSGRATEEAAESLHALVCEMLTEEIRTARTRPTCDECGCRPGIAPALLAQAIKFLSENGIDSVAPKGGKLDSLKAQLPRFEDEDAPSNIVRLTR
jgi:hypothetical protein